MPCSGLLARDAGAPAMRARWVVAGSKPGCFMGEDHAMVVCCPGENLTCGLNRLEQLVSADGALTFWYLLAQSCSPFVVRRYRQRWRLPMNFRQPHATLTLSIPLVMPFTARKQHRRRPMLATREKQVGSGSRQGTCWSPEPGPASGRAMFVEPWLVRRHGAGMGCRKRPLVDQ